jgi:hypothetical protein
MPRSLAEGPSAGPEDRIVIEHSGRCATQRAGRCATQRAHPQAAEAAGPSPLRRRRFGRAQARAAGTGPCRYCSRRAHAHGAPAGRGPPLEGLFLEGGRDRKAAEATEGPSPGVASAWTPGPGQAMGSEGRNRPDEPGRAGRRDGEPGTAVGSHRARGGGAGVGYAGRAAGWEDRGCVRRSARVAPPDPARDAERRRTAPPSPPRGGTIREAWRVCRRRRRRGSHCTGSG